MCTDRIVCPRVQVTLSNYRCFSDAQPLRLPLHHGFTALVGPNNTGKSSILKFFYEFRTLWGIFGPNGDFFNLLRGGDSNVATQGTVDPEEVFCDRNDRVLTIRLDLPNSPTPDRGPAIRHATISFDRAQPQSFKVTWNPDA